MRATIGLVGAVVLAGCAAGYQAGEMTDKFSDPTGPAVYAMRGNSIDFHDPLGAVKPGELNAYVARDRATNKPLYAGFFYNRSQSDGGVAFSGEPRWLSVRQGDELVILADGARLVLKATGGRIDGSVARGVGYSVDATYFDTAQFVGTVEDLQRVAKASRLQFQVQGLNGAISYPRQGRPLLESFQRNIAQFYQTEVAPYR